jgi:hypothetical protein
MCCQNGEKGDILTKQIDAFHNVINAVEPCKVRGVFFCVNVQAAASAIKASQAMISLNFQRVQFGESLKARGKIGRSRCQRQIVVRLTP